MRLLQIYLFGNLRITYKSRPLKVTRTVQVLLAYLTLNRHRTYSREVLAGTLWGDFPQDRARNCLSTALWRLGHTLKLEDVPRKNHLVTTSTNEVGFNTEAYYWLDVAVFEEQVRQVLVQPVHVLQAADVGKLENVLQLYKGDLLEDFYYEWVLAEREHLHNLYLSGLIHLMHYYEYRGDYQASLAYGQQILGHDPLREDIHREMMQLYLRNGQRALAARQYEICHEVLTTQLNVSPAEETRVLYDQIALADELEPKIAKKAINSHVLQQLHQAMRSLDKAQRQLERAIRLAEQLEKRSVRTDSDDI